MPLARCKFYNDNGEPVKGGCHRKGTRCAFIHPEDPNWSTARPPSFRPRDKGGDSGGFNRGAQRGPAASSGWDAGGNAPTSATDARGGCGDVKGWGDDTAWGGGWGTGASWGGEDSTSTMNQAPEPAQSSTRPNFSSTGQCTPAPMPTERNQAVTIPIAGGNSEHGWGRCADSITGSGWGSAGNNGWGTSSWGNNDGADTASGSGWGNMSVSGWGGNNGSDEATGSGWGNKKDAERDAGSARNVESDSGSQDVKDAANSWRVSNPTTTDRQETEQNKTKGKAVPAPPRIKTKIAGTNNEPLGIGKQWGEPRGSITTLTPVAPSTPVTVLTPTDSSRLKRKLDVAFDDKLDVFKEYVKSWERGVRARFLLAEAEAKRDRWFRTQKSACYARIGEAGRKRLDGERTECDKEVNLQRDKLSSAITSLAQFHDTVSSNLDLGQRYNIGEQAEKFITESKAFVDEVRDLLVKHVLKDKNDAQTSNAEKHPSGALDDAAFIGSLRSQVRELEERFDQAQTELTLRHQRDIHSEIDELLAAKIAALRMARQREIDRVASQSHTEIVIPPNALEKIEGTAKRMRELDAKIPQTVKDIRALLFRIDATTKRVGELEDELSASKATYNEQVQQMAAENEAAERRMSERLKNIQEQFEQLVASQSASPVEQIVTSPATCDSRDRLMESLRPEFEAVVNKFYKREVQPTIEALQQDVVEASDRHQAEAIQILWGKVQPAMNMVAGVSRWLDSQELRLTAPNA